MKETVFERPARHRPLRTVASRTVAQTLVLFLVLGCTALAAQQEAKAVARATKAQKMKRIEAEGAKPSTRPARPALQPCGGRLGEGREAYIQQWSEPCEYTFAGRRAHYFLLNLEASPGFVPSLRLIAPDGERGRGDRAAYLRPLRDPFLDGKAWQLPRGGNYTLRVGSAKGLEGRLIISGRIQDWEPMGSVPMARGCIGGPIDSGSVTKTLSSGTGSCSFKYIGMPDDSLTIRVTSTEVDPKVEVWLFRTWTDRTILASDDDGGEGSNSLIPQLALTQGGSYRIVVSSRDNADGDFTLELENQRP